MTLEPHELTSAVQVLVSPESEPFPLSLRLVTSNWCAQTCRLPNTDVGWCHSEGLPVLRSREVGLPVANYVRVSEFFHREYGIRRARIGGLGPEPEHSYELIQGLKEAGFCELSLTTSGADVQGRLRDLKRAGLDGITISVPHSSASVFSAITGRGDLDDVLDLVLEAQMVGLSPVKVNRVLLQSYVEDIGDFVSWIDENGLTLKLLELMWCRATSAHHSQFFISWKKLLPAWLDRTVEIRVQHYRVPLRTKIAFHLAAGGIVEVNYAQPRWSSAIAVCRQCPFAFLCDEGYLGCGVRIWPDLRVVPCLLRPDLAYDLKCLVTDSYDRKEVLNDLESLLGLNTSIVL